MIEPHHSTSRLWVVALLGLVVLVAVTAGLLRVWVNAAVSHEMGAAPAKGLLAPDFSVGSRDGEPVRLSAFHGRPVVLVFLALQSEPCRAAAPELQAVQTKNGRQVVFLGFTQDAPAAAQAFSAHYGLTFPLWNDEAGRIAALYRVRDLPTVFIVDAKGVIAQVISGPFTREQLDATLDALPTPANDFGPMKDFF